MATQLKELLDEVGVKLDKIIAALTPGGDAGHPETILWFGDGTSESYDWSGEISQQNMIDVGLYSGSSWTKIITRAEIGTDVTSIVDYVFDSCTSLTSITIPNSVTNIGDRTFSYSGLMSVTIPDTVTSIGVDAFYNCSDLTSITLGNSITTIGSTAFTNTSLTSISFPSSISSIGINALDSAMSLTSVTFQEKTMAEVQAMNHYSWGINPGIDIVCSDGIIVAPDPGASSS